jgi:hypothetical protein
LLNDLLRSAGNNKQVTKQEAANVMKAIDQNGDGHINKYELFRCFKYLTKPPCKDKKPTGGQGVPTGTTGGVPKAGGYGPQMGGYGPMAGYMPTVGVVPPVMPIGGMGMMGGYAPMGGMPIATMGFGPTGEFVI